MNALRLGESRQLREGSSGLSAMTATGKVQVGEAGAVRRAGAAVNEGGRGVVRGECCVRCGAGSGATGAVRGAGGVARRRSPPAWSTPGRSRRGRCGVRRSTGVPERRRWGSGRSAEPFRLLRTRRPAARPQGGRRPFAPRVVRSASESRSVGYWWKSRFFNAPPGPGVTRPAHRDAQRSRTSRVPAARASPALRRTPAYGCARTRPRPRTSAGAREGREPAVRSRPSHALLRRQPRAASTLYVLAMSSSTESAP